MKVEKLAKNGEKGQNSQPLSPGIWSICPQAGAEQPLELRVAPEHAKRSIDGLAGHVVTYPTPGSYVRHVRPNIDSHS